MKDEEELPEPSISLGVPHVNTPKAASFFTQTTYPCDICGPILNGLLDVGEYQGTHTALITYSCRACEKQFWLSESFCQNIKHNTVENSAQNNQGEASLVKNFKGHVEPYSSEKPSAFEVEQRNLQDSPIGH